MLNTKYQEVQVFQVVAASIEKRMPPFPLNRPGNILHRLHIQHPPPLYLQKTIKDSILNQKEFHLHLATTQIE